MPKILAIPQVSVTWQWLPVERESASSRQALLSKDSSSALLHNGVGISRKGLIMDKTAKHYENRFWAWFYALLMLMFSQYATTVVNAETFSDFTANCENVMELFKGISIDVLPLSDGTYRAYYMGNGIVTATSSDGVNWTAPVRTYNNIVGAVNPLSIGSNPWVFQTHDDRYRMIFQSIASNGDWLLYRAISPDGITFTYEGLAFAGTSADYAGGHIGLSVPTGLRLADGSLRMYYSGGTGKGGIMSALSFDDGITWIEEIGERISSYTSGLADPSSLFKISSAQYGNVYGMMYSSDMLQGGYPQYIRLASSVDMLNFNQIGEVFVSAAGSKGVSDSEVVSMPDGRLRMYFSVLRGDPTLTSTYTCLLPTSFHEPNCKTTINGNLLLNIPYLSYATSSDALPLWANLLYVFNPLYPSIISFKLTNYGAINNSSYSCAASTLSSTLKIHIPDVLLPDGITHLWADLEYSSALSTGGNFYWVVSNYGVAN